jgi:hypothetical protein
MSSFLNKITNLQKVLACAVLLVSCLAVGLTLNTVVVNADNEGVWKRTC